MTTRGKKKKSGDALPITVSGAKPFAKKFKSNRNSIAMRPYKHVEMTKAEMYEDLRKAVENTK